MKKILQLKRLSLSLAIRVIYIYLLKAAGITIKGDNLVYLNYFNFLYICNLQHRGRDGKCFKVMTHEGVCIYMRKYPSSDSQVLYQIWHEEEYAVVVDRIKKNDPGKKLRIVDAGANVGYASVYLYQKLKDHFELEFIVIEPGDENVSMIEKNFSENRISNYHLEKAGLFNKSCYLALNHSFRDGKDWSLSVEEVAHPTDLKGVELLDLVKKYGWDDIGFCKIDIEGSEKYLFEDAAYASRLLGKIDLISIEIHEEFIPASSIEKILAANAYSQFKHGEITVGYK